MLYDGIRRTEKREGGDNMTQKKTTTVRKPRAPKAPAPHAADVIANAEVREAVKLAYASAETISAAELALIVSREQKNLRAYMRSAKLRDQSTEKNNAWKITLSDAVSVAQHYFPAPAAAE
jgi:predicted nucleic acid-binding protein